jgi:single-strand DNA-binding protein
MASFNKVLLMGNLTRDPELRYSGGGQGGSAICKFGLAVNRQWRDAQGQNQEEVTFVDITVFGRQAETCNEYLRKGRPVFVEGRLQYSTWEDRESGQKRSKLDVVGERVQFLGGANRDGAEGGGGRGAREAAPAAAGSSRAAPSGGYGGAGERPGPGDRAGAGAGPGTGPAPGGGSGAGPAGGQGVDFDDIPF